MPHQDMLPKKSESLISKVVVSIFSTIFVISLVLILLMVADVTQIALFVVIIGVFLMALLTSLDTQK